MNRIYNFIVTMFIEESPATCLISHCAYQLNPHVLDYILQPWPSRQHVPYTGQATPNVGDRAEPNYIPPSLMVCWLCTDTSNNYVKRPWHQPTVRRLPLHAPCRAFIAARHGTEIDPSMRAFRSGHLVHGLNYDNMKYIGLHNTVSVYFNADSLISPFLHYQLQASRVSEGYDICVRSMPNQR